MKECKFCEDVLNSISCHDNPNSGFSYNLYQCDGCGSICRSDVWNDKGELWISEDKEISFDKRD